MPRDRHGHIVTWSSGWLDGEPMLGTNDAAKVARCILERLCGACGDPLDYWIAFLGDEVVVKSREFLEPPMHVDCARYSIAVCPYLASPDFAPKRTRPGVMQVADRTRSPRMALYITRGFRIALGVLPMSKADAPHSLEWF